MQNKFSASSELAAALWSLRRIFFAAGGFSFVINMIMLVPAIYMLQIYDRVLSSRSESTLLMLTLLVLGLYALMGGLEWVRSRLLVRAGSMLDAQMNERVFTAAFEANLQRAGANAGHREESGGSHGEAADGRGVQARDRRAPPRQPRHRPLMG